MQTTKKKEVKPFKPSREPDIAFWFDENEITLYLVRVKDSIRHVQLLQASFDLLAKAMSRDDFTVIGEFSK